MFQYTHELVLNTLNAKLSADVENPNENKVTIERGGEYYLPFIQGGIIWKTEAVEGALDKITLDVSALGLTTGKNYALNMFVKLVDPHALFEYGYPNYNTFGKQILIDFQSVNANTDAQTILDSILPQVMENDLTFVKGKADGSNVILEVGHTGLRFDSLAFAEYDPTTCDSCVGEYMAPHAILDRSDWATEATGANSSSEYGSAITHTVVGIDPFATGEWLIENLRFPSYPNIRWAAINESNRPIPGEKYTMYSFAYESPRVGLGGLSGVGQKLEAVTRHIYYVRESLVNDFETLFAGCAIKEANAAEKKPKAYDTKSETARTEMSVNEHVAGKAVPAASADDAESSEEQSNG